LHSLRDLRLKPSTRSAIERQTTPAPAYPEPDGESLPEPGNYRMAVTARQSIEGELNHPK